jgi:S1-C subfamily serine protease
MKAQHHFLKIIMYVIVVILGYIGLLDLLQLLPKKENNIIDQPYINTEPKITHDVTYDGDEQNNIDIYDQYNQAVVNISTQVVTYNWFFDPIPQDGGIGSGAIIDKQGYVLTNYHVIKDAYKVTVRLFNNEEYEGQVVGVDEETDLALIKFDPKDLKLPILTMGNSDNLRVGQKILAIGNPFAFERTLTTGIISGLGRPIRNDKGMIMQNMIQTDAAINPGNSGGPLLNKNGEIIGINTMIYSPSGGSVGIGFSVPINVAKRIISDLKQYGKVNRGRIDADLVPLFPSLTRYARLSVEEGLLVSEVDNNGLAARAGLRGGQKEQAIRISRHIVYLGGDIITKINGHMVTSMGDYYAAMEQSKPGDSVQLTIVRDGRTIEFSILLTDSIKKKSSLAAQQVL